MHRNFASLSLFCVISLVAPLTASAVTIQWSPVGNAGNANDPADGDSDTPGIQNFGAVGYAYNIGTKNVTNSQYAEFLNTKDPSGANTLFMWNINMASATFGGISFNNGNPSGSKYVLTAGRQDHPVNFIGWYESIRFANWLNNGQGSGDTETGAYTLGTLSAFGLPVTPPLTHNVGSQVWLPTENEWYKAAYYNPGTSSYFQYATSTNTTPIASGPTGLANHANYNDVVGNLTDVGAYTGTTSPYGAFDMSGNLFQWNEALIFGSSRGLRGGSFNNPAIGMHSSFRGSFNPVSQGFIIGFRLASVPEPSTGVLGIVGCALMWVLRKRFENRSAEC